MTNLSVTAQKGTAKTVKKTFNRTTTISQYIDAEPSAIWPLLTNASDFPRWNSTIVSIEGDILKGEKIKLKSTLQKEGDRTLFTMTEKIGGPMFPLFANKIPPFDNSFEQFTADLKKEAESK